MRSKTSTDSGTITSKILGAHSVGTNEESLVRTDKFLALKVDHVVLARNPDRVLRAFSQQEQKASPEVCVVYPPCAFQPQEGPSSIPEYDAFALSAGFFLMKRGAGYGGPTHLERFSAPGKVVLTDEPRLAALGGVGMLSIMASTPQLVHALVHGETEIRSPICLQIQLSGRLRPFVNARDVTLEMMRRGVTEVIRELDARTQAPVALEFGGPSAKLLSIAERAILCGAAPRMGAAFATFASDDKTEGYLRDQKRSKAFRQFSPDSGAAYEGVVPIDLGSIDPLLLWTDGRVVSVREMEEYPISTLLLGGDSGASLRDLLSVASLLKSKRIAPHIDALLSPPSRQMLEVLARTEHLADLLASGVRLVEADRRLLSGEFLRPAKDHVVLQSADPELSPISGPSPVVASSETLAFSALGGKIADPRGFKRPQRIAVPRSLPTEDVMLSRAEQTKGPSRGKGRIDPRAENSPLPAFASAAPQETDSSSLLNLSVVVWPPQDPRPATDLGEKVLVANRWEDLSLVVDGAHELPGLRMVVSTHIPANQADILSSQGVLVLRANENVLRQLGSATALRIQSEDESLGTVELGFASETALLELVGRPRSGRR